MDQSTGNQYGKKDRLQNTFGRKYRSSVKDRLGYAGLIDLSRIDLSKLREIEYDSSRIVMSYVRLEQRSTGLGGWRRPDRAQYGLCKTKLIGYLTSLADEVRSVPDIPCQEQVMELGGLRDVSGLPTKDDLRSLKEFARRCNGAQDWALLFADMMNAYTQDYFFEESYSLPTDWRPKPVMPTKQEEQCLCDLVYNMGLEEASLRGVGWTPLEPASKLSVNLIESARWLEKNLPKV